MEDIKAELGDGKTNAEGAEQNVPAEDDGGDYATAAA